MRHSSESFPNVMATLADAGALVALLDRKQDSHREVVTATKALVGELVTTCAAFTEAMYLIKKVLGRPGQERLWGLCSRGTLEVAELPQLGSQRGTDAAVP
jgi:predicted nucleic acid-binding protein